MGIGKYPGTGTLKKIGGWIEVREIKFRAWEKSLQEIIPVHDIDFSSRQINTNGAWRLFNEVELMQYTGLHDKNGKEIYEGDIVRTSPIDRPMIVKWDDKSASICITNLEGRILCASIAWEVWVVIGNIYQNPGLLEGDRTR